MILPRPSAFRVGHALAIGIVAAAIAVAGDDVLEVTVAEPVLRFAESEPKANNGTFLHRLGRPMTLRVDTGRLSVRAPLVTPGEFRHTGITVWPFSYGWRTALGDFDGDGDLDVFVSNFRDTHRVLLNDGSGLFPQSIQVGGGPHQSRDAKVGDLDGDGDLDVVAWSPYSEAWLEIFTNSGSGTLSLRERIPLELLVRYVALGDVDGDADLDMMLSFDSPSGFDEDTALWWNLADQGGGPRFVDSGQRLAQNLPLEIELADLDGDEDLDAFFAASASNRSHEIRWNDEGDFTLRGTGLPSSNLPGGVRAGDVDADGDVDVVTDGLPFVLWLNDGSGQFESSDRIQAQGKIDALVDLDGNGSLDGIFARDVWLNDGAGTFTATGQSVVPKAVGDLNNDALPDVLQDADAGIGLFLNGLREGVWNWVLDAPQGPSQRTVTLTVEDDEGRMASVRWDIEVLNSPPLVLAAEDQALGDTGTIRLGSFSDPGPDAPWQVDVDWGDGSTDAFDVVTAGDLGTREHVYATEGSWEVTLSVMEKGDPSAVGIDVFTVESGTGPAVLPFSPRIIVDEGPPAAQGGELRALDFANVQLMASVGNVRQAESSLWYRETGQRPSAQLAAAADMDDDQDLDLIAVGARTRVWLNRGDGTFETFGQGHPGGDAGVDVADFDDDGDLDVLVHTKNRITRIYYNDGAGLLIGGPQQVFERQGAIRSGSAVADFDGDGDLDVFMTSRTNPSFATATYATVLANRGDGVFVEVGAGLGVLSAYDAAAGDIDDDGDPDVVVARLGTSFVARNRGSVSFTRGNIIGARPARAVALGDLDGDGDLDAFLGGDASHTVGLNDGTGLLTATDQVFGTGPSEEVALGDVDGDGDLDAWTAGPAPQRLWLNDGAGTFSAAPVSLKQEARRVTLADFSGDGIPDAFEIGRASRVLIAESSPTWLWSGLAEDGPASRRVTITALDGSTTVAEERFDLIVHNVAPSVVVTPEDQPDCSRPTTVRFLVTDPSPADTRAGFTIEFSVRAFEMTLTPRRARQLEIDIPPYVMIPTRSNLLRVYVTDKDGDRTYAGRRFDYFCY